jgi:ferredoxin
MWQNGPHNVEDKHQNSQHSKGGNLMGTHYIIDDCVACGACEPVCPVSAISEDDPIYIIDKETCTDCGACDDVCPVDAIKWEKTAD